MSTAGDRATQDKVRATLLDIATEIADDSAPPLHLPSGPHRRADRLGRTLAPVAAAAALLLIAITMVTTSTPRHSRVQPTMDIATVPTYYVAIRAASHGKWSARLPFAAIADAVVRSTSGTTIATIAPPKPYISFVFVSAAADDRTFVLAAQRAVRGHPTPMNHVPAIQFFQLRIDPAAARGHRALLAPLNVPIQPTGTYVSDIALSPDTSKLAVISTAYTTGAHEIPAALFSARPTVHVYDTATGRERTWPGEVYTSSGVTPQPNLLSWTADSRMLALISHPGRPRVLLIDTDARPGTGVTTRTDIAFLQTTATWEEMIITPDAREVFLLRTNVSGTTTFQRLEEYSLRTGKRTRVIAVIPLPLNGNYQQVFWSSPSGRTLLIGATGPQQSGASVYIAGRYRAIPWSPRFITAAW